MEFDIEVINESSTNHELMMALQKARNVLRDLLDVTEWMTGSEDFSPGGKAWEGFNNIGAAKKINAAHALVGRK